MKRATRICTAGLCAFLTAAAAGAQVADFPIDPEVLGRLGVNAEELVAIQAADGVSRRAVREAQIELEILTAQLKRALLPIEPRMREVETLLSNAMQWELKMRLAEITRQVQLRQILGDLRYARIREALRRRQQQLRQQQQQRLQQNQRQTDRAPQRPNTQQ